MSNICYIIYKTTNLVNDKIYVGQHYTSANDGYLGSGKILDKSIKKCRSFLCAEKMLPNEMKRWFEESVQEYENYQLSWKNYEEE
jgi:hypothetical protein